MRASVERGSYSKRRGVPKMNSKLYGRIENRANEQPSSASSERLLLEEMTHRVINDITGAIFTLSMAAREGDEKSGVAFTEIQHQLENIARTLRLLYVPRLRTRVDACVYLRQLCQGLRLSKLQSRGIEIIFVERPLRIDSDQCWRLGMIISELVTNAAHHAFNGAAGHIRVDVVERDSMVDCRVEDNGASEAPRQGGNGMRLIAALARELRGNLDQRFGISGSVSTLRFPVF